MADPEAPASDEFATIADEFKKIAEDNRAVLEELLASARAASASLLDPLNVSESFAKAFAQLAADPARLVAANLTLWQDHMALWQYAADRMMGGSPQPIAEPEKGDRRFRAPEWNDNNVYDVIKQSYLITSRWLANLASDIDGLDAADAHKIEFHTRQLADALSPSNFALTNPEVMRHTVETQGRNLVQGLANLKRDLDAGGGNLRIQMTDRSAFTVGEDIATSPGKVVFRNDLAELIQYSPSTDEVYRRPLMIVPPWINKFYILDLQPRNSFIRYAVERGYTVFVVSWVNPDGELSNKTFADYMSEGILEMLDAIAAATGEREVNLIGYCIGGTLTGATLAYMAATGDDRVQSTTFFNAQMDFSEAGDLKVFIDEPQLEALEERMRKNGYLEGSDMATAFNMLRANDLIWSFYVNNYLLGKDSADFDLLYWNDDATRMPQKTHLFYLRECYLNNNLAKPGAMTLRGVPIDLGAVTIPMYIQAAREDHIAPFNSVFKSVNLFSGPIRFMLAGSGHIAGVVNPPAANKYSYRVNDAEPRDLDEWLAGAVEHPGSWWDDWDRWLSELSGEKVPARTPGDGELPALADAPGTYVLVRS